MQRGTVCARIRCTLRHGIDRTIWSNNDIANQISFIHNSTNNNASLTQIRAYCVCTNLVICKRNVYQCNTGGVIRGKLTVREKDEAVSRTRNIGIVAHIDAGKTTTTERMLFYAGVVKRIGEVDNGTTTTDFMKEEMDRGITIQSAAVSLQWRDHTINLIDTPGHVDFTVEVERAMRVVDGVVALFDASVGVQAQSYTVLQQSRKFNIPAIAFLNKMDKFNANFDKSVQSIREKLRVEPLLVQFPLHTTDGQFNGVIDLPSLTLYRFSGEHGEKVLSRQVWTYNSVTEEKSSNNSTAENNSNTKRPCAEANCISKAVKSVHNNDNDNVVKSERHLSATQPRALSNQENVEADELDESEVEHVRDVVLHTRHTLIAQLTQYDDTLAEELINNLDLTDGDDHAAEMQLSSHSIHAAIRRLMLYRKDEQPQFIPVLCGASRRDQGVQPLLDAIVRYLPSPIDRTVLGWNRHGKAVALPQASCANHIPTYALAFKVTHTLDATGQRRALVFLRVYTGRLAPRMTVYNHSRNVTEIIDKLYVMHANNQVEVNELCAGAIGAAFLKVTTTGDTLFAPEHATSYQSYQSGYRSHTTNNNNNNNNNNNSSSNYSNDGYGKYQFTVSELPLEVQEKMKKYNRSMPYDNAANATTTVVKSTSSLSPSTMMTGSQTMSKVSGKESKSQPPSGISTHSNSSGSSNTNGIQNEGKSEKEHESQQELEEEERKDNVVYTLEGINAPLAVLSFSIEAATKHDVKALAEALDELSREDPSLRVSKDNFGNVVLSGMGELHLEIVLSRLHHEYHIDCRLLRAIIEYRETARTSCAINSVIGMYMESPYVECSLELHPLLDENGICASSANCCFVIDEHLLEHLRRGENIYDTTMLSDTRFSSHVTSSHYNANNSNTNNNNNKKNALPIDRTVREVIEIIEGSFTSACAVCGKMGPLAGLPLHGVEIKLTHLKKVGGSLRDLNTRQLIPAARSLITKLIKSIPRKELALLEPMMEVEVHLSEPAYIGNVVTSLNEQKAVAVDLLEDGLSIRATAPMRNLVRYTMQLRKAVKGHANLFIHLQHYRVIEDKAVLSRILKNLGVVQV